MTATTRFTLLLSEAILEDRKNIGNKCFQILHPRTMIPERVEKSEVSMVVVSAYCLESFVWAAQRVGTQVDLGCPGRLWHCVLEQSSGSEGSATQGKSSRDQWRVTKSLWLRTSQPLSVGKLLKGRTRGTQPGMKNLITPRASGRGCKRALPQTSGKMCSRMKAILILSGKA